DDPDFDLPASGVLVWHIDQSVIDQKLSSDRLQTNRNWRAVDLEEMDGSEDIGNTYQFLTPSYGTEYGIREDAFYAGNELWQEANKSHVVEFGPYTIPSTKANNGGESHITLANVSAIDDTMTLSVVNTWEQGAFPKILDWADGNVDLTFADLDEDDSLELCLWDEAGNVAAFRADGSPYAEDTLLVQLPAQQYSLLAGSTPGILYAFGESADYELHQEQDGFHSNMLISYSSATPLLDAALIGEPEQETLIILRSITAGYLLRQDFQGELAAIFSSVHLDTLNEAGSMVRVGPVGSDTLMIVLASGRLIGILKSQPAPGPSQVLAAAPSLLTGETVGDPVSADFDGDGGWDVAAVTSQGRFIVWYASEDWGQPHIATPDNMPSRLLPSDVDGDGLPELVGVEQRSFLSLEANGLVSEGTPVTLSTGNGLPMPGSGLLADVDGLGGVDLIVPSVIEPGRVAIAGYNLADGRSLTGFPLDFGYVSGQSAPRMGLADLDSDGDLELVTVTRGPDVPELRVYDLPARVNGESKVFWGLADGDPAGGRAYPYASRMEETGHGRTLADAYVWPNPIRSNNGHVRFFGTSGGNASLRVYDLVGRLVIETRSPVTDGVDNEITINVAGWPSGVYVARLESNGTHTLIRFAVVH
ncbi:MAG: T9SS type A sorting domain-containing protein, partial [bacterium]